MVPQTMREGLVAWLVFASLATACTPVSSVGAPELGVDEGCADVVNARVETSFDGTHTFTVTVVSDDQGWDKYADAWIIRVDGTEIGRRVLTHPHDSEQPFTRSLSGVVVPAGATVAVITANDSVVGECGRAYELSLVTP